MDVTAPVTDYLRGSLLTTKGDIVKRGAAVPARLGIGLAGQIVRVNATPDDLEYQHPGQFLFDKELSGENAGIVSVTTSWTNIKTLDLGTVVNGDRFFIACDENGTKTGTAKLVIAIAKTSGTSTIAFLHDLPTVNYSMKIEDGWDMGGNITAILKVTGSGTLVITFRGQCSGGSYSIAAGEGQIYAIQLKNA